MVRSLVSLLLLLSLLAGSAAIAAPDPDERILHALTREQFERAKMVPLAKDGALGDAAAGSDRYDMLSHLLDLKIDPGQEYIEGDVTYVFASVVDSLRIFVLDLTDVLSVDAVFDTQGDLGFVHQGDSLQITLPTPLAAGEQDTLTVRYSGHPVEPSFDRGLMFRTHRDTTAAYRLVPIVANLSEPAYAQSWWPCKDKPGDKAYSEVILTVPDTLYGVSNGEPLRDEAALEPGWHLTHWRENYPIASYLVSVAVSDYVVVGAGTCQTTLGDDLGYSIPLSNWVFPLHIEEATADFEPLCDMMELCESRFGPYPFRGEKYGHAEFIWWGAMEHQTVTSIGTSSINGDGTRDWLIVHELGHQWFGDHLTPAAWRDIWLNEGFATYTEALWREDRAYRQALDAGMGEAAARDEAHDVYLAKLEAGRSEGDWADQGPVYDPVPVFPGGVIYDKGAWILHMLRGRLGDETFFELLGEWGRVGGRGSAVTGEGERIGYHVTTEEWIELAEIYAGESLGAFFWPYLEEIESPEIVFQREIGDGTAGAGTQLTVSLRQVQARPFDNVFPIRVVTEAGSEVRTLRLTGPTAEAVWQFDSPVSYAVLDPDHWVLWRPASGVANTNGITRLYPNPSRGSLLNLRYHLGSDARIVFRVYDALGREVHARDLGTIEAEAGFNELSWDQRGADGRRLASGVYWAALEIDGHRSVRKFTILR